MKTIPNWLAAVALISLFLLAAHLEWRFAHG